MKHLHCLLARSCLLLVVVVATAAAQDEGQLAYRVAGTIAIDAQRAVAMIESSAGEQQLYRLGEHIDGWEIMTIDPDQVILGRAGQVVRLPLEGKLVRLAAVARDVEAEVAEIRTGTITIDFGSAFAKLQDLEEQANAGRIVLTNAMVNRALGLSASTHIRHVGGEPAASPTALVQLAIVALAKGYPTRLSLTEDHSEMVYLMPNGESNL